MDDRSNQIPVKSGRVSRLTHHRFSRLTHGGGLLLALTALALFAQGALPPPVPAAATDSPQAGGAVLSPQDWGAEGAVLAGGGGAEGAVPTGGAGALPWRGFGGVPQWQSLISPLPSQGRGDGGVRSDPVDVQLLAINDFHGQLE